MRSVSRAGLLLAVISSLFGCATPPQTQSLLANIPGELKAPVELVQTPFFPQQDFQCGPAALATILQSAGVSVEPQQLAPGVYLPGRKGSLQIELISAARRYDRIAYPLNGQLAQVLRAVKNGYPVLVLQNLATDWYPIWHYAVVIGFDLSRQEMILRSGTVFRHPISISLFERTWQRAGHWAIIILDTSQLPEWLDVEPYFRAVSGLESAGRIKPAISAYEAGVRKWPSHLGMRMGLGNSYYRAGNIAAAMEAFAQVLNLSPRYAPAHNNLAHIYFEAGHKQTALQHARKAVELGGTHIDVYRDTLRMIESGK